MRKSTLIWFFLAAICSATLFYVSEKNRDTRENLEQIAAELKQEEEALRVLKTEWSYLNQPKRLEKLAKKHLKTDFIKISQFVKTSDILPNTLLSKNLSMPAKIKTSINLHAAQNKKTPAAINKDTTTVQSESSFINMLRFWGEK